MFLDQHYLFDRLPDVEVAALFAELALFDLSKDQHIIYEEVEQLTRGLQYFVAFLELNDKVL